MVGPEARASGVLSETFGDENRNLLVPGKRLALTCPLMAERCLRTALIFAIGAPE